MEFVVAAAFVFFRGFGVLTEECKNKAMEFESSQKLREEELDAIGKASEIIAGSTVSGAAKHLESGWKLTSPNSSYFKEHIFGT